MNESTKEISQRSNHYIIDNQSIKNSSKGSTESDKSISINKKRSFTNTNVRPDETSSLLSSNELEKSKMLTWMNVTATVPLSKRKGLENRKTVLRGVSGVAHPGEVLAIMGGSGAGKTTLMNILAHLDTKGVEKKGEVRVNGRIISKSEMQNMSAYVQQTDIFCGTLTVKEQLTFSALLRMGSSFSTDEKKSRVEEVLREMNLIDCQNTLIGIPNRMKGISIGEKKRLAFASEALRDPSIFFCDEPTSGLDAFMAAQVVNALRLMAEKGKTIITVIHQPSSTVFNMFHKVLFMANGQTAYHGPINQICPFFEKLGGDLIVPECYNPADHMISKLSINKDNQKRDILQIEMIVEAYEESDMGRVLLASANIIDSTRDENSSGRKTKKYAASFFLQFCVLFHRAFLTNLRDPLLLKVKFAQLIITAIVIGIVNWKTPIEGPAIQNLEGVMYNTARDMNFLFLFPSINVITSELPVFYREQKARIYSTQAYYLSKGLAELPLYTILPFLYSIIVYFTTGLTIDFTKFVIYCIVCILLTNNAVSIAYAGACIFGDEGKAVTYMPVFVMPMLVFGGFYINFRNIPIYFKPFSFLSWFRYGFEALQVNQWGDYGTFDGCGNHSLSSSADVYCPSDDGPGLLAVRDISNVNIWINVSVLIIFFIFYRLFGLIALMLRVRFAK